MTHWGRRFPGDTPNFKAVNVFMAFGVRGSGKSTLLEHVGMEYMRNGCAIRDL